MNKTLVITTIVLVAVVMGMSAVAPMIPQAYADHPCDGSEGGTPHACGSENRPTCEEIADRMRDNKVPEQVVQRMLSHCVD